MKQQHPDKSGIESSITFDYIMRTLDFLKLPAALTWGRIWTRNLIVSGLLLAALDGLQNKGWAQASAAMTADLNELTTHLKAKLAAPDTEGMYHDALEKVLGDVGEKTNGWQWQAKVTLYSEGFQVAGASSADHHAVLRVPLRVYMAISHEAGTNQVWSEVWMNLDFTSQGGRLRENTAVEHAWTTTAFDDGRLIQAGDRTRTLRREIDQHFAPFLQTAIEEVCQGFLAPMSKRPAGTAINFQARGEAVASVTPQAQDGPALKPCGTLRLNAGWSERGRFEAGFESATGRLDDVLIYSDDAVNGLELRGARWGGPGGVRQQLNIRPDEEFIGVEPWIDTAFESIIFHTSKRTIGPYGENAGDPHIPTFVPAGYHIVGFSGWSEQLLTGLVIVARPVLAPGAEQRESSPPAR